MRRAARYLTGVRQLRPCSFTDALGEHAAEVHGRSRSVAGRRFTPSRPARQVRPLRRDLLWWGEDWADEDGLEDAEPEVGRRVL